MGFDPKANEKTEGLGELIRAHRIYTGLSRDGMARQLGVRDQTYEQIEDGKRGAPPGFLDSVVDVVKRFDAEVDKIIDAAENKVSITVSGARDQEWERMVVGRAAVECSLITPVLI